MRDFAALVFPVPEAPVMITAFLVASACFSSSQFVGGTKPSRASDSPVYSLGHSA
jgi:hypothetical protein